jgi:hypothetical protein
MIFIEYMGIIMDFQVLLLTIDNIMSEHSRTRRLTLLTLIDARVDTDNGEPDFVQSIRLYPGHHGEFGMFQRIRFI